MRGMEGRPGCEYRLACWVGVVAEDLDAQQRFYHDVLGLAELAAGPGNIFEIKERREQRAQ